MVYDIFSIEVFAVAELCWRAWRYWKPEPMNPAEIAHAVAAAAMAADVPASALALVHVLADQGETPTTQAELRDRLGVNQRTVRRHVAALTAAGLLKVELSPLRGDRGGRGPSVYRLTPPD